MIFEHDRPRPDDRGAAPALHGRARLPERAHLPGAGRGLGRPALRAADHEGDARQGEGRSGSGTCSCPTPSTAPGLTNLEYTPLCEIMGRSGIAPRVFNCQAPDTGNAEILAEFGTPEQKERWLKPLLEGDIRSCFSMTEPEVSGADPTGLQTRADRDGDHYVINGHKWFTSGAIGARFAIVMAVTNPKAAAARAPEPDHRPDRHARVPHRARRLGDGPRRRRRPLRDPLRELPRPGRRTASAPRAAAS